MAKKTKSDDDIYDNLEKSFKKRGLGRGLNALFEDEEGAYPQVEDGGQPVQSDSGAPNSQRRLIDISAIEPGPYQPRTVFEDKKIAELANSMEQHGVLQPLLVRARDGVEGGYEIIAGERRWRAAMKAKLHEIPVVIKEFTDKEALEIGIIENLQREDLNALDEAAALQRLIDEFSYTQEEAAQSVGKSRSYVANMVRLNTLPKDIKEYIWDGKLSAGHARTLITSDDPIALAKEIVKSNLSVRDAEALSNPKKKTRTAKASKKSSKDVDHLALEHDLSNTLGLTTTIEMSDKKKGKLSIAFKDLDQLDMVIKTILKGKNKLPKDA
jgi:ParB family chromosome partitioning protein